MAENKMKQGNLSAKLTNQIKEFYRQLKLSQHLGMY